MNTNKVNTLSLEEQKLQNLQALRQQKPVVTKSKMPKAVHVRFDDKRLYVELDDERVMGVPLQWFPRLAEANLEERQQWEISPSGQGIYWEDIDEDISVKGLF